MHHRLEECLCKSTEFCDDFDRSLALEERTDHESEDSNWAVVAEAIQTILRREKYPNPYEALKDLTRGQRKIDQKTIHRFVDSLQISATLKKELKQITPHNYTGVHAPID